MKLNAKLKSSIHMNCDYLVGAVGKLMGIRVGKNLSLKTFGDDAGKCYPAEVDESCIAMSMHHFGHIN